MEKISLGSMTSKQKAMAAIFVVIVLLVIWQVMGLMGGGGSTKPTTDITPTKSMSATNPSGGSAMPGGQQHPGGMTPPAGGGAPAPIQANNMPQQPQQLTQTSALPMQRDTELMNMQKQTQHSYLEAVDQLQMLRVQREIAEANQAIAAAKLATVTAEKNVSDLLTKPAAPVIPAGAYANKLVGPTMVGAGTLPEAAPAAPVTPGTPYVVISVSMGGNKWSAVLGYNGKLYNVSIGDVLPDDGSKVVGINRDGVTLDTNGTRKKISLVASI